MALPETHWDVRNMTASLDTHTAISPLLLLDSDGRRGICEAGGLLEFPQDRRLASSLFPESPNHGHFPQLSCRRTWPQVPSQRHHQYLSSVLPFGLFSPFLFFFSLWGLHLIWGKTCGLSSIFPRSFTHVILMSCFQILRAFMLDTQSPGFWNSESKN